MAAPSASSSSSSSSLQYAFRAEKSLGIAAGPPDWSYVDSWDKPQGPTRTSSYSSDGRIYAVATNGGVCIYDVSSPDIKLISQINVKQALEIALSPKGSYLSTWSRPIKLDDGAQHKNLQIFSTSPSSSVSSTQSQEGESSEPSLSEPVVAFTQKDLANWKLQFTEDEAFALRSIQNEVQVLDPAKDFTLVDKLRIEGLANFQLGPGKNPSIAVFVPEKKGMPGSVRIHSLSTLAVPSIQKSFFKADRGSFKWNSSGTSLLFLSSTDHDKTGKSYYGETNLYLMTPALQYEARLILDKEGGIGDFAWNPANGGKEFAVSYGFMPAKTTLFDTRLNVLHEFGSLPRNFVSFNNQGRLLCIAGFGNLAGHVDIWDRSTLKKVATFQASNCTECTWSPDGRLLLCSTLSPRLRVDNGVKIYHWSGELIHVDLIEELYQAAWRPIPSSQFTFPRALSPAPAASSNVQALNAARASKLGKDGVAASPLKPVAMGAYRPPGLRNREGPSTFRKDDDDDSPSPSTPGKQANGRPAIPGMPNGAGSAGRGRGRTVPGAGPPGSHGANKAKGQQGGQQRRQQNGGAKKDTDAPIAGMENLSVQGEKNGNGSNTNSRAASPSPATPAKPSASTNGLKEQDNGTPLTPEDKKRRALQKKLGAIEALKAKRDSGEKLEKTQEKKIEAEAEVRKELAEIGA